MSSIEKHTHIHNLMRDTDDGDCIGLDDVKYHMLTLGKAAIADRHIAARAARHWMHRHPLKSGIQTSQILFHPLRTPMA